MPMNIDNLRAVIFDYGNTLIEFTESHIRTCDKALADTLERIYGPLDLPRLNEIRDRDRRAPYTGEYLENDMESISTALVRDLFGRDPSGEELCDIIQTRYTSFVAVIDAPHYLEDFLADMGKCYKLGLLSNYPDGCAIRDTLAKLDLADYFDAVVVSGDVGRVKPHALPFETVLAQLGVAPEEALYVGDNWLGDIQGAKGVGMQAAFIVQYDTPEKFDRQPGDHDADVTIEHLTDLREMLLDAGE
jgi:HAD superfamily hydrolase (TIGR01549 family)